MKTYEEAVATIADDGTPASIAKVQDECDRFTELQREIRASEMTDSLFQEHVEIEAAACGGQSIDLHRFWFITFITGIKIGIEMEKNDAAAPIA